MKGQKILIDVGSSTVKVYLFTDEKVHLVSAATLGLKEGFDAKKGVAKLKLEELYHFVEDLKKKYPSCAIELYGTALFRRLAPNAQEQFIRDFYEKTKAKFFILSHEQENFYLEKALLGRYSGSVPVLILNIGGGSTEIVLVQNEKAVERYNIPIGVGQILEQYPTLNNMYSKVKIDVVKRSIKSLLPSIKTPVSTAINTGGELTWMRIAQYNLKKNTLFEDNEHPVQVTLSNFKKRNRDVYKKLSLQELENLMPSNPGWMQGARPYLAFAEAVFDAYDIKVIIPSDSNLINGVVRSIP